MWFRFYICEGELREMTWLDVVADTEMDASGYVMQEGFPSWEIYNHIQMGSAQDLEAFKFFSGFPYKALHRKARSFYAMMLRMHDRALGTAKQHFKNGESYAQLSLPF